MSVKKILLFLTLFFNLIFCKEDNKTKEKKSELLNSTSTSGRKVVDSKKSFNMTIDEMDTMMLCTLVVQEKLKKEDSNINKLEKKFNLTNSNIVNEKIATDIFENCNKNLDIKIVNNYIKNLTFLNRFKWEKSFDEVSKVDYGKYKNTTDLEYTLEQQVLMYRFEKVEEIYKQKQIDDRERYQKENQKIRIGKFDLENIPNGFKLSIFLIILFIFFGGIFYFLKSLQKKPKDKKKKKKIQ